MDDQRGRVAARTCRFFCQQPCLPSLALPCLVFPCLCDECTHFATRLLQSCRFGRFVDRAHTTKAYSGTPQGIAKIRCRAD